MTVADVPSTAAGFLDLTPLPPAVHHEPLQIADDVFLIRQLEGEGSQPMCVYVNSLVIAGTEPVIVDTGAYSNRDRWLEDVFAIVEPDAVRWIYISHDDHDHLGNLQPVLERCPNATLVVNWLIVQRLAGDLRLPMHRMRWLDAGEHLDVGDRTLVGLRPPTFDSPSTRGLFDTKSRVYWSSDSFGAAVPYHVDWASDLPLEAFTLGLAGFNRMLSPWVAMADPQKFADSVQVVRTLDASRVATCHGPAIGRSELDTAFGVMTNLPSTPAMPMPGQHELEAMLDAVTHGLTER